MLFLKELLEYTLVFFEYMKSLDIKPQLTSKISDLQGMILQAHEDWLENQNDQKLLFSISALPGTGKTSFLRQVEEIRERLGLSRSMTVELPMDLFLATNREGHEREEGMLLDGIEAFRKLYCDQGAMKLALVNILETMETGGDVHIPQYYDRMTGTVQNGKGLSIPVPQNASEIITEGSMNAEIVAPLRRSTNTKVIHLLIVDDPHKTLERAVRRDVDEGRSQLRARRKQRSREYQFLIPLLYGEHGKLADIIFDQSTQYRERVSLAGIDPPFLGDHLALVATEETQ